MEYKRQISLELVTYFAGPKTIEGERLLGHDAFFHKALGSSGFQILAMFCDLGVGKRASCDLSCLILNTGIPRRTIFRKLHTLEKLGYIKRQTQKNELGRAQKPKSEYYLAKHVFTYNLDSIAKQLGTYGLMKKKINKLDVAFLRREVRLNTGILDRIEKTNEQCNESLLSSQKEILVENTKICTRKIEKFKKHGLINQIQQ